MRCGIQLEASPPGQIRPIIRDEIASRVAETLCALREDNFVHAVTAL